MEILTISQILLWVAVGAFLTIVILFAINWYRNIYGRPPEPDIHSTNSGAIDRQTAMFKTEMRKQTVDRQHRADDVKAALDVQEEKVQEALGVQADKVQKALGVQADKVNAALDVQADKVNAEFEKQKTETKEHFGAQREIIEALNEHQTATRTDLSTETQIIKDTIEAGLNEKK